MLNPPSLNLASTIQSYSNTTLVNVKLIMSPLFNVMFGYSNTTLVNVKFKSMVDITVKEYPFKYNTC